jgi:integrase
LRRYWLLRFADHTSSGPYTTTTDDVVGWLAGGAWRPETRKSALASLRGFYRWAVATGRTDVDPTGPMRSVRVPPAAPRPTPDAVLAQAAQLELDDATVLMVQLARLAGLRRAEIAGLHTRDITPAGLVVTGKGGRVRVVPVHHELAQLLEVLPYGWVFPSPRGGHLTPDNVGRRISRVLGPGWSAHSLRHRFATQAYGRHHDLLGVQRLLGHASPATTQRYADVPDEQLRRLVAAVS